MNIKTKILLSAMIVSLSALVVPLEGHSENSKTELMTVQMVVKSTENMVKKLIEKQPVSINFEFYLTEFRVTLITSLFQI